MSSLRRPLLALAAVAALAPLSGRAQVPAVLVPEGADSGIVEPPPAPLIVPGALAPADTTRKTAAQRAVEEFAKGQGLERMGFPGAAMSAYVNAARFDSTLRGVHLRMGELFLSREQWGPAAYSFSRETALDPGNRHAAREYGWALANLGDSARSIRHYEMLVRRDARDTLAWHGLGFAYARAGRPADAERALRRALIVDPRLARAHRDLGVVLAGLGRRDEALRAYQRAHQLDPRDATVLLNLGNLEARARRWPEALDAYQRAERADSTLVLAYRGQAEALGALGRDADAGETYRRWLRVDPTAIAARVEAIGLFERLGRHDIALELARDGVRRAPRSGEAHLALGMAQRAGGEMRAALESFRAAERWLDQPEQRERVRTFIRGLREAAPDSLRALFLDDSVRHEGAARP